MLFCELPVPESGVVELPVLFPALLLLPVVLPLLALPLLVLSLLVVPLFPVVDPGCVADPDWLDWLDPPVLRSLHPAAPTMATMAAAEIK